MKKFTLIIAFLLILPTQVRAADPIFRTLQWKHDTLVLTGENSDPLVNEQISIFRQNVEALKIRDIAMIRFFRDDLDEMDDLSDVNYRGWYNMDANEQRFMERLLQTDNNKFSVALVGKDGELTYVWKDREDRKDKKPPMAVPMGEIFYMIDNPPLKKALQPTKDMEKSK